ncbi:ricin-type beta-trefoil lectin domain protein, partial [Streptomyces sparsus]
AGRGPSLVAVLVACVAALAVAAGTAAFVVGGAGGSGDPKPSGIAVPAPPAATETVTVSAEPEEPSGKPSRSPAPEPSATPPSASPSPSQSAPPAADPPPAMEPHAPPRRDSFTQYVNAHSGLCLDIQGRLPQEDRDADMQACEPVSTQKWTLDDRGLLRNYSDPGLCLDSRGGSDRGPGLRRCSGIDGRHGHDLRFYLSEQGALRPFVAHDLALTPKRPSRPGGVGFQRADGGKEQRWLAGSSTTSTRE